MDTPVVLVCPMDWGLGHASRCVPVIRAFIGAGFRVVVASSGPGAGLLTREFGLGGPEGGLPGVIPFPGFRVRYSSSGLFGRLLLQLPAFLYHIYREKRALARLAERLRPAVIVSDNRYGVVHSSIPSVIITHQVRPVMPAGMAWMEGVVSRVIRRWLRRFDECWIPDCPGIDAGGGLTAGWEKLPNVYFTGLLSRFEPEPAGEGHKEDLPGGDGRYSVMFILSGPEPQRTVFEKNIISKYSESGERMLLVRGLPHVPFHREVSGNMEVVSFMDSKMLLGCIRKSDLVVCRSGYSSVMDLLVLRKRAVLVPTPGQTEQEYLAEWLHGKGWFGITTQKEPDLSVARGRPGANVELCRDLLQRRIESLRQRVSSPGRIAEKDF